jgi:hypothetical protein
MAKSSNRSGKKSDAVFIGWQKSTNDTYLALFNVIVDDHPSHGSTVSELTLHELNLQIPRVPFNKNEANELRSSNNEREKRME